MARLVKSVHFMRFFSAAFAALCLLVARDANAAGEPHSAHQFPQVGVTDLVAASVELRVEPMSLAALKFFALQVDFDNGVGAHGGPQAVSGKQTANWGALTSNANYNFDDKTPKEVRLEALEKMQNAPVRTEPFAWSPNVWYRLEVVRGDAESLPAGDYSVLDEPKVHVDHARSMRKWTFVIKQLTSPAGSNQTTDAIVFTKTLHVASETMSSFLYWTETGYGVTCEEKLRVHWRSPKYSSVANGNGVPSKITKSISQSTCSAAATTDIHLESTALMGTIQTFGEQRPSTSKDGDVLYPYSGPALGEEGAPAAPQSEATPNAANSDEPSSSAAPPMSPSPAPSEEESSSCGVSPGARASKSSSNAPLIALLLLAGAIAFRSGSRRAKSFRRGREE